MLFQFKDLVAKQHPKKMEMKSWFTTGLDGFQFVTQLCCVRTACEVLDKNLHDLSFEA